MSAPEPSLLVPRLLGLPARKKRGDGFGQSLLDDIRFARRFRRLRRTAIAWRVPEAAEEDLILGDPMLGRFAEDVAALGEHEGMACVVLERLWHGWPDPPRYALFAVTDGTVWAAADFDEWPAAWPEPPRDPDPLLLPAG